MYREVGAFIHNVNNSFKINYLLYIKSIVCKANKNFISTL